jgi:hypothetical protein
MSDVFRPEDVPAVRAHAKHTVEVALAALASMHGRLVSLQFDDVVFPVVITDVKLAKLTGTVLVPEQRLTETGKRYTPPLLEVTTDAGTLLFDLGKLKIQERIASVVFQIDGGDTIVFAAMNPTEEVSLL